MWLISIRDGEESAAYMVINLGMEEIILSLFYFDLKIILFY